MKKTLLTNITASTHDTILFFTNKGKLYKLRGYEIPEAGRTAKGTAIVNLLSLDPGEKYLLLFQFKILQKENIYLWQQRMV